jgi:hypothetical protein
VSTKLLLHVSEHLFAPRPEAGNSAPTSSETLSSPSLQGKLGAPHPSEKVFTFILILAVKLGFFLVPLSIVQLIRRYRQAFILVIPILPADPEFDPFCLQNEFAHLVLLAFLRRFNIFPSKNRSADCAADVADSVLASDQVSRDSFVLIRVGEACRMYVGVTRLALDEIGTTVAACETFANNLGRETQVCRTF